MVETPFTPAAGTVSHRDTQGHTPSRAAVTHQPTSRPAYPAPRARRRASTRHECCAPGTFPSRPHRIAVFGCQSPRSEAPAVRRVRLARDHLPRRRLRVGPIFRADARQGVGELLARPAAHAVGPYPTAPRATPALRPWKRRLQGFERLPVAAATGRFRRAPRGFPPHQRQHPEPGSEAWFQPRSGTRRGCLHVGQAMGSNA